MRDTQNLMQNASIAVAVALGLLGFVYHSKCHADVGSMSVDYHLDHEVFDKYSRPDYDPLEHLPPECYESHRQGTNDRDNDRNSDRGTCGPPDRDR